MTDLKKINIFFLFCLTCLTGFGQTKKTVDTLESQYQTCLDKGQYMLSCSKRFYQQMDSLLNINYKKIRSSCDSLQKENLKDEQLEWLEKRDKNFVQNQRQTKKADYNGGQDQQMIIIDKNAMFVKERVIALSSKNPTNYSPENYKVNPTGIYSLDNKTETKNGDIYGYFGDIEVKEISASKIVVRLFACKGAPSYNSGTLTDTLVVTKNKATYTTEDDPSCKLVFTLYRRGIMIEQFADNPNFACGFGHAVDAYGFYKKQSSKIPTDKQLTEN